MLAGALDFLKTGFLTRRNSVSSQQIYALVDAFERDIRDLLTRFVIPDLDSDELVYGVLFSSLSTKRAADPGGGDNDLVEYLDLRQAYDLLNTHRGLLPLDIARQARELTSELDIIVPIRHRVMHSRPLAPGDFDSINSAMLKFDRRYFKRTSVILDSLRLDNSWLPADALKTVEDRIRHNLPQAEYDETGLLGRDVEVKRICDALKRKRDSVITLCGEGGIGKTALAVEVAYSILDDPEEPFDLVLWTSLKTERLTGAGVQSLHNAAASLIGITAQLGQVARSDFIGGIDELRASLEGFRPLIIIDNLETISGDDFITLYERLPDTATFLVTSREGIGQIERRIQVGPLLQRDALALFNQLIRFRDIKVLSTISGTARAQMVNKLRCSPLAIRWFILATEAGRNPVELIRHQEELLTYCVQSVYQNLSRDAVDVFIAMEALRRPVTPDDLVLMLNRPVDRTTASLRELARGSLVRSRISGDAAMVTVIELTETARNFASAIVPRNDPIRELVQRNESAFLRAEEERTNDNARRELGPNAVRIRVETDAPTAQILRRALTAMHKGSYSTASGLVQEAKHLNPEFWEVHRVEGFIEAASGNKLAARESYLTALDLAETEEHKSIVSHFLAGHLARNMMEVTAAIPYARRAHAGLSLPDTASSLGSALVWNEQYDEGIEFLESALERAEGRMRIIAVTALADAYCRRAESASASAKNPVQAAFDAICGYEVASDEVFKGASDKKLRDAACEAASAAVRYLQQATEGGHEVDAADDFHDKLRTRLTQLRISDRWSNFVHTVRRIASNANCGYAVTKLSAAVSEFDEPTYAESSPGREASRIFGTILSVHRGFGFIATPALSENVYFHKTSLIAGARFSSLTPGLNVSFRQTNDDGRLRAQEVELIG